MFNLFGRKAAPAPKPASENQPKDSAPNPLSSAFDHMEVMARCFEGFMDQGTFVGGLDAAPGFRAQVMPNGMQVWAHRDKRIGVILDKQVLAISVAGVAASSLALLAASVYFKHYHKHEPDWLVRNARYEPQSLAVEMPFGTRYLLHMICKDEPVSTQFDEMFEPGCTLMITVRANS